VPDADLLFRPVHELAALVRDGELGARELVAHSLARIEALEPEIGAFVDVDAERALAAAAEIGPGDPRPFAGVPIAVKNNKPVQGLRFTFCAELLGDHVASHDAFLVRRLREAGFVIVGTTKLPEFGILPTTEPSRFGPTHNPWDLGRTPGGSSGGSAAAVAAGMVPIAHGNDGGGSTRIPAACCGLVGLKPSRGRISQGPDLGDSLLSIDGVLTRTVGETAALLDLLAGYETGDATWAPPPAEPFAATAAREPRRLRIALTTSPPLRDHTVDPVCETAARDAAALLEALGHEVVEATPPWSMPGLFESFSAVFGPLVSTAIGFGALLAGRPPTEDDVEALSWHLWERAIDQHSIDYLAATLRLQAATRAIIGFFDDVDVVLTPALGERPLALGVLDATAPDAAATFFRSGAFTPFTAVANVTGQPAISLPLYHGEDGLPTGVQLFGRPADEGTLLALATQVEAANPWADRRAPVAAGAGA
jgi:amidase